LRRKELTELIFNAQLGGGEKKKGGGPYHARGMEGKGRRAEDRRWRLDMSLLEKKGEMGGLQFCSQTERRYFHATPQSKGKKENGTRRDWETGNGET